MDIDEDFDVDETTSGDDGIEDDGQSLEANQSYKKLARYKKLGFHPQKEIYCNKYLPYAEHLDDESQRMLADVKEYLAVAVASREMVPAIANAVKRLIMWVYGRYRHHFHQFWHFEEFNLCKNPCIPFDWLILDWC